MALALRTVTKEDIGNIALGFIDAYLMKNIPMAFVVKNVGIPAIKLLGLADIPDWIVKQAEVSLGYMLYALLKR